MSRSRSSEVALLFRFHFKFRMPLFKIESPGSKRILINAESISQIIEIAIKKLNLPADEVYTLALQEDETEIDDDEILIQLSQLSTTPILLTIFNENKNSKGIFAEKENNQNILNEITSKNLASPSTSTSSRSSNNSIKKQYVINMKEGVWDKVSDTILTTCQKGEKLLPAQRQALNRIVADYMINVLQQTSRRVAEEMAINICNTFPQTFKDTIDNQQWGSGIETLRMQIYNCVQYMKHTKSHNKRALSPDSDDADEEMRKKEAAILRRQDIYGCVEYAPKLPSTENSKSQEEKRLRLLELFATIERDTNEISHLMTETYPTLRGIINEKSRNIVEILVQWPFLKESEFILQHSSILLGKNIQNVWSDSLSKKVKPIRQYIKFSKKIPTDVTTCIINEYKTAVQITKENTPKILAVFPLLLEYFREQTNFLFKIISIDIADADVPAVADSDYPVLIIRGNSLYDFNATYNVVIERRIMIFCDDVSQGILISFLAYYVFGICYPKEAEKTLEFIQRVFLNINPHTGGKRNIKSKRKGKTFDTDVYNLARAALSVFLDTDLDAQIPLVE